MESCFCYQGWYKLLYCHLSFCCFSGNTLTFLSLYSENRNVSGFGFTKISFWYFSEDKMLFLFLWEKLSLISSRRVIYVPCFVFIFLFFFSQCGGKKATLKLVVQDDWWLATREQLRLEGTCRDYSVGFWVFPRTETPLWAACSSVQSLWLLWLLLKKSFFLWLTVILYASTSVHCILCWYQMLLRRAWQTRAPPS